MLKVTMYISFEQDDEATMPQITEALEIGLDSVGIYMNDLTVVERIDDDTYYCDTCKHGSGLHCPDCHEEPCVCDDLVHEDSYSNDNDHDEDDPDEW